MCFRSHVGFRVATRCYVSLRVATWFYVLLHVDILTKEHDNIFNLNNDEIICFDALEEILEKCKDDELPSNERTEFKQIVLQTTLSLLKRNTPITTTYENIPIVRFIFFKNIKKQFQFNAANTMTRTCSEMEYFLKVAVC